MQLTYLEHPQCKEPGWDQSEQLALGWAKAGVPPYSGPERERWQPRSASSRHRSRLDSGKNGGFARTNTAILAPESIQFMGKCVARTRRGLVKAILIQRENEASLKSKFEREQSYGCHGKSHELGGEEMTLDEGIVSR